MIIPRMDSFIRPAVISTENLSGATVFQIADEDASAILDYLAILEEYGLGEITYSDEDAGYPLYIWAESCQKNLEPEKANVHGLEVEYYVMILMDYDGEYYYVTPFYADSMNPQSTGDTWNGVPLEASDAEEPEAESAPPAREEEKKF